MTTKDEALKMALEALENLDGIDTETECVTIDVANEVIACRAALAQKDEQEPFPQLKRIHPLDVPLEVFLADLSTRAANVIRAEMRGFDRYSGTGTFDIEPPYTVRHLCMFSKSEMKRWPNFGKKCLNEVCEMLRARGLQLWDQHDERSLRLLREHPMYFKRDEDQTIADEQAWRYGDDPARWIAPWGAADAAKEATND